MMCIQLDAFISQVDGSTVSNPVAHFFPGDATLSGASPEADAGYNYVPGNGNPSTPLSLPPSMINQHTGSSPLTNVVGTLVSFTNTSSPGTVSHGVTTDYPGCAVTAQPLTQGFWKNHTSAWPALPTFTQGGTTVSGLTLGTTFYTAAQLETILETPPSGGNALLILAHQEIAAKLNILNGSMATTSAIAALTLADTDLAMINPSTKMPYNVLTDFVQSSTTLGTDMVNQSNTLDTYNSSGI
jgi:hypothetical protein